MEEILRCSCACYRPIVFLAPLVDAHDEDLDSLTVPKLILDALQQVAVPLQCDVVLFGFFRRCTEIQLADLPSTPGMSADRDKQILAASRGVIRALRFSSYVVPQRATLEDVVPRRNRQRRNADLGEMILDGPALPVIVIAWMRNPIQ